MEQVRVFFSHSSNDDEFGRRLVADLRAHLGEDAVWYDVSGGLHGGDEWWNRIVAEITARDTFLVLFSPDALTSDWVPREMGIAYWQHVKLGKRLMPLMYRTCEPPPDWQLIHALPFTDDLPYDERLTKLLRELGYTGPIKTISLTAQPALAIAVASTATLNITNTPTTPKERLVDRLTQEVHTAFGRENWRQVLLRAQALQDEAPEAMTPQMWRELGLAALELEDGATTLAALDQALAADPYDVPTLRGKAQALILQKQFEEAMQLLKRAQIYVPMDDTESQLELLTDLITELSVLERWDDVVVACEQALSLDFAQTKVWRDKGIALIILKRLKEALIAFNQLLTLDPGDPMAWWYKGSVLTILSLDNEALTAYDKALTIFVKELAFDPSNPVTWSYEGAVLDAMGRYEEAVAAYDQVIALDPLDPEAYASKSHVLAELGRVAETKAAWQKAKELRAQRG